jgi:recombination associated protein RdgC
MFKTFTLYRFDAPVDATEVAFDEERLKAAEFVACGPSQPESHGWIPPRGEKHGALIENIGGQLMLRLRSESRKVPGSVVSRALEARLDKMEAETGRRPKGKHAKEIKDEVLRELLPRAFTSIGETLVWIDKASRQIVVGASGAAADKIITALSEAFALRIDLVQTQNGATTMMAHWLQEAPPTGFTVDRECKLAQPDSEKSRVAYSRHNLDSEEITEHLRQGKLVESLALTWGSRVSFVLTDKMHITKVKLLDVVFESNKGPDQSNGFDADVAITTGELSKMIADLIEAMGGPLKLGEKSAEAVPQSAAAEAVA